MLRFFIGFDTAQADAAYACARSMQRWVPASNINFIRLDEMKKRGYYWRTDDGTGSTEFTYTRFLVPYLSGYTGHSVFCDSDFLWRRSPYELLPYISFKDPVRVVKHNLTPEMLTSVKMNGKEQKWYPRKNWSSLMLFNNDHCKALTPAAVSTEKASWLHGFEWCKIDQTEPLPNRFNHLVGYYPDDADPVAAHFTDGGPWMEGYEDVAFAEEWRRV